MASCVHQFFLSQALHLREGRFDNLVKAYSVPLLVMLPSSDRFMLLDSRHRIMSFFVAKFEGLKGAGIDYLRASVSEIETASGERTVATVVWHYVDANGARQGQTVARYFLRKGIGGISVEMIEFERLAFTAIADWVRASAEVAPRALNKRQLN